LGKATNQCLGVADLDSSSLQRFYFHCIPLFSTLRAISLGSASREHSADHRCALIGNKRVKRYAPIAISSADIESAHPIIVPGRAAR
jgi:hypothetical protein